MKIVIEYKIKKIREEKGLSIRELADICDVSHTAIHYIENGKRQPTLYMICAIAEALQVRPEDLYSYCKQ